MIYENINKMIHITKLHSYVSKLKTLQKNLKNDILNDLNINFEDYRLIGDNFIILDKKLFINRRYNIINQHYDILNRNINSVFPSRFITIDYDITISEYYKSKQTFDENKNIIDIIRTIHTLYKEYLPNIIFEDDTIMIFKKFNFVSEIIKKQDIDSMIKIYKDIFNYNLQNKLGLRFNMVKERFCKSDLNVIYNDIFDACCDFINIPSLTNNTNEIYILEIFSETYSNLNPMIKSFIKDYIIQEDDIKINIFYTYKDNLLGFLDI